MRPLLPDNLLKCPMHFVHEQHVLDGEPSLPNGLAAEVSGDAGGAEPRGDGAAAAGEQGAAEQEEPARGGAAVPGGGALEEPGGQQGGQLREWQGRLLGTTREGG